MLRRLILTVLAAALVPAGAAAGATRFAAPGGAGSACTEASPCSLQTAVESVAVADGDEVILTGDATYVETGEVTIGDAITVRGEGSPLLQSTAATAVRVNDAGALLQRVSIEHGGAASALLVSAGVAENVAARTTGGAACAVASPPGGAAPLLRDSTCLNTAGAAALSSTASAPGSSSALIRNVTAYALAPGSSGLRASGSGGASVTLDARNAILSGVSSDAAATAAAGSQSVVALTSSNFATESEPGAATTVTDPGSGSNQIAEPVLANPSNGFFNQLITSPTIDLGTVDPLLGASDIDGEARVQGPAPDIGADEILDFVAPETTITSGPPDLDREARPTFRFVASEPGSTFRCTVDDEPAVECESPYTTGALEHGAHSVRVRAIDPAGNADPTPAERSFEIDRVISGANASARPRQRQRGRPVELAITVRAGEPVRVRGKGRIRLDKRRSFSFDSRAVSLEAGERERLRLRPRKRSASRKILKALRRRSGAAGVVGATFTDGVGNRATLETPVELKRGV